jgi:cation diffusion facilitator CzcD-associated flavoprotein CzcO
MTNSSHYDVIVVGAGFGGMYMVHQLTAAGLSVKGFERGRDVGGTWYWNRYPGCQCDVESMEYSYQFSEELQQEWNWSNRYAGQAEILEYACHVADQFDLRKHFTFNAAVNAADYQDDQNLWRVQTDKGDNVTGRFFVMATGCLSTTNIPAIDGLDTYKGKTYHTGNWPHEGVDFAGKKIAVIGTGSSAIQSIPLIATQAADLTVFQRTPNYTIPARNHPMDPSREQEIKSNYKDFRARGYIQPAAFGADYPRNTDSVLDATPEERKRRFEEHWQHGGFMFLGAFGDTSLKKEANFHAQEFVRGKIRSIVKNPDVAELLCPDTILGCKRLCADNGYYDTFNNPHVHLVDISDHPIERLTTTGLTTNGKEYDFDAIVFATGFDAMTGSLFKANISGAAGMPLTEKWEDGPGTYLGLMTTGFPNMFTITGPGSPSALANLITGVEQHANFITALIQWADTRNHTVIEPEQAAEDEWVQIVNQRAEASLYPHCNSWYLGANIPGKPRVFMPYLGFPQYTDVLKNVVANDYEGLRFGSLNLLSSTE